MTLRAIFAGFAFAVFALAAAQQGGEALEESSAAARAAREREQSALRQDIDRRFLDVERRLLDKNDLMLRRVEQAEARVDSSQRQIDVVLLIFALSLLLGFFFISGHLRMRQRLMTERVSRATGNAEKLMRDIQRELNRPELEYLHISQLLRQMLRQLRDPERAAGGGSMTEIRAACNDPYLPTSLHFIARVLAAEHDGNWNIAVQMLDQLREMDAKDPDVLLHLSHVHKNLAARAGDREAQNRHQRMAYQYYTQFTATINASRLEDDDDLTEKEKLPPPPTVARVKSERRAMRRQAAAENSPETAAPSAAGEGRPSSSIVAPPAAEAAGAKAGEGKPSSSIVAPARMAGGESRPSSSIIAPARRTATESAPPAKAAVAEAEKAGATGATAENAPTPAAKTESAAGAADAKAAEAEKAAPAKAAAKRGGSLRERVKSLNFLNGDARSVAKKIVALSGEGMSKAGGGFRAMMRMLAERQNNEVLPALPAPAVSEPPPRGDNATLEMWREIVKGDKLMTQAAAAKTLRERNRVIDAAMGCYAQAQAHKTNKTLYYNWGIALLAKSLHVAEKKRAPLHNAAIDKFLAGNVVAPHYFDFHLASLHAIIGNKEDCLSWLEKARESENLDVESLMQAPDFDSVRNEPWFDKFLAS